MEIKLNYTVDNFQVVGFQYEENIDVNSIVFEYIGNSIYNAAVFNTNKFFSLKSYDSRCLDMNTPLKVKSREAEEQVTLASASLVNTVGTIRNESVNIDYFAEDVLTVDHINLTRGGHKKLETESTITIEDNKKILDVNRYLKSYNPINSANVVADNTVEVSIHNKIVNYNDKWFTGTTGSIKHANYNSFRDVIISNSSSSRTIRTLEQIRLDYIKNASINNIEMFLSKDNSVDIIRDTVLNVNKVYNDISDNSFANTIGAKLLRPLDLTMLDNVTINVKDKESSLIGTVQAESNEKTINETQSFTGVSKITGEAGLHDDVLLSTGDKRIIKGSNLFMNSKTKSIKTTSDYAGMSTINKDIELSISTLFSTDSKSVAYTEKVVVEKYSGANKIELNYMKTFSSNLKYMYSIDSKFIIKNAVKGFKNSGLEDSLIGIGVTNKILTTEQRVYSVNGKEKALYLDYTNSFTDKITKEPKGSSSKDSVISVWKDNYNAYKDLGFVITTTDEKDLNVYAQYKLDFIKKYKSIGEISSEISSQRNRFELFVNNYDKVLDKVKYDISFTSSFIASKSRYSLLFEKEEVSVSKSRTGIRNLYDSIYVEQHGKDIDSLESVLSLSAEYKDINISNNATLLSNALKSLYIEHEEILTSKARYSVNIEGSYINLYNNPISINIEDSKELLSKRDKVINIAKSMIRTDKKYSEVSDDYYIVSFDSTVKDTNFNDYCKMIDKGVIEIFQNNSQVILDVSVKNIDLYGKSKTFSNVTNRIELFSEQLTIGSIVKNIGINDKSISVDSIVKSLNEFSQGMLVKDYKDVNIHSTEVQIDERIIPNCAIDATMKTFSIKSVLANYNSQERFDTIRLMRNDDSGYLIDKNLRDLLYDNDKEKYFMSKAKVSAIIPMMEEISKDRVLKDIVLNEGEWLYDNSPHSNLDLTAGGIDELLLPQVDFDYTLFKEGLLDPVTHRPISPVKVLPDGSFIARRPVNHPLPEYTDIAKDYLKVNVSLLKHILEIFYKIWQQNIFKFGAMDMRTSVAKMLEYLDAYVEFNIPTPLVPESKRVIRLIRWYGEAAILKHAEYKIKYIYEPLKSGLDTGVCQIPNIMENMFVDTRRFSITNNMLNVDSWIEFEIDNPVDTEMSFMAYISNEGTLDVYVNDELDSTYQMPQFNVTLDIPKVTAQKNKVKLFFKSINNGIINIANVVISDMVYSDIETEYSPTIGSGNKVLDDLVKRVSIYGDLYENSEEFIKNTINGNLAITDLIDKLNEYFSLHHDRKSKGKRKVTKQ